MSKDGMVWHFPFSGGGAAISPGPESGRDSTRFGGQVTPHRHRKGSQVIAKETAANDMANARKTWPVIFL